MPYPSTDPNEQKARDDDPLLLALRRANVALIDRYPGLQASVALPQVKWLAPYPNYAAGVFSAYLEFTPARGLHTTVNGQRHALEDYRDEMRVVIATRLAELEDRLRAAKELRDGTNPEYLAALEACAAVAAGRAK